MKFQKGQSGNPGGRPKEIADVRELARQHTKAAIEKLAEWMGSDNPKASVAACVALLNRGHGMPAQSVTTTIRDVRSLSDAELIAVLQEASGEGVARPTNGSALPH